MTFRRLFAALGIALLAGCAANPQPDDPTDDPANPAAPEAAVPPRSQTLAIQTTDAPDGASGHGTMAPTGGDAQQHGAAHGGQSMATAPSGQSTAAPVSGGTSGVAAKVYTCPHHPEVVSDQPGKCPKCNMTLRAKSSKPATSPTAPGDTGTPDKARDGHGAHEGH